MACARSPTPMVRCRISVTGPSDLEGQVGAWGSAATTGDDAASHWAHGMRPYDGPRHATRPDSHVDLIDPFGEGRVATSFR